MPEIKFNSETKLIDVIKEIHEFYNPDMNEIIIKIGKKRYAKLVEEK